ncbi:hypothetical protein [Butyrivibrio sp. MC2013]|uniref:hypothetical protein n=1 Tax=Butyrivibrio sp. MC2013 TaxID=1280686 RepID=UPI000400BDA3|nr:hypothetical protein [Butyrivibrio sp. MC2013]
MRKAVKGSRTYIDSMRRYTGIRTGIIAGVILAIFIAGLMIFGNRQNALTIIAIVLCLPGAWSAVNLYMYLRAHKISDRALERIEGVKEGLYVLYDLCMTSEKGSYNVSAITVMEKNIIGYSEDEDMDSRDCQEHIRNMIAQSGYHDYTIKIFDNLDKFCDRLGELEKLRIAHKIDPKAVEDAWVPGTKQTVSGILQSVSL